MTKELDNLQTLASMDEEISFTAAPHVRSQGLSTIKMLNRALDTMGALPLGHDAALPPGDPGAFDIFSPDGRIVAWGRFNEKWDQDGLAGLSISILGVEGAGKKSAGSRTKRAGTAKPKARKSKSSPGSGIRRMRS